MNTQFLKFSVAEYLLQKVKMMTSIGHILHPVCVAPSSDLVRAQPITFETMRIAKDFAYGQMNISLYYTKYSDETPHTPSHFIKTSDLNRSVGDVTRFQLPRKLALIRDILDRLYESCTAEYFIYTNVDIAVMPYFYLTIGKLIEKGFDAFVINRRTITEEYYSVSDLPLMYSQLGENHPGHDCFVFKRSVYPHFLLGDACIGCNWIGKVLIFNLIRHAVNFCEFPNLHSTFHLGDRNDWRKKEFEDYDNHNNQIVIRIIEAFREHKDFIQHPIVVNQLNRLRTL